MMGRQLPFSNPCGRRRGFTLIEVLAALVIFAVAIVGVIEGIGTALAFQSDVAMRQRAAMLASNVLEEIKYGNDLAEGEESGQFEGDDAAFTWKTAIEPDEDFENLVLVTAIVSWGPTENPKEYAISTLMCDQGIEEEEEGPIQEESGEPGEQNMSEAGQQGRGLRF